MTSFLKRASFAVGVAMFAALSALPSSAAAATGPWNWTDVSSQVSVRTNRPVWAMAYADSSWFYTDGQDLTTTGHVWMTDGQTSQDISSKILAAGVTRVDDIVSDGQTVLFLKNENLTTLSVEVVAYDGTNYTNRTMEFRSHLQPTEDISHVVGNSSDFKDQWILSTTFGRSVLLNKNFTPSNSVLPTDAQLTKYTSFNHSIALQSSSQTGNYLVNKDEATGSEETVTLPQALQSIDWKHVMFTWTGASWMMLDGKNLYRIRGNQIESYGQTRDYFVTMASNGNGTVLLGGAASNGASANPTNPLTAKLVQVTEGADVSASLVETSTWTWVEPYATEIHRDQTLTYNVGAWSPNGLKRIDIFVNWVLVKSCDFNGTVNTSQTCAVPISGNSYQPDTTISMVAKITNGADKATWTSFMLLTVKDTPYAVAPNTNTGSTPSVIPGMSVWSWFQPNVVTMDYHDTAVFAAQANAQDGLSRIDIAVNGTNKIPCDFGRVMGTQNCSYTINGLAYSIGQELTLTATARDNNGNTASQSHTLTITDNLADAGSHPAVLKTWMSPSKDQVANGETVMFYADAQDTDGLAKIEILANNKVVQTCSFTNAYDKRECSLAISNTQFPANSNVTVLAKAYDNAGNVTLANARGFYIAN